MVHYSNAHVPYFGRIYTLYVRDMENLVKDVELVALAVADRLIEGESLIPGYQPESIEHRLDRLEQDICVLKDEVKALKKRTRSPSPVDPVKKPAAVVLVSDPT